MTRPRLRLEPLEPRAVPAVVGGLDPSFGTGGKVTTTYGGTERAAAVVVQPDGLVLVAGSTTINNDILLARYNPDGTPDAAFGGGTGRLQFTFGGVDVATGLALQPDGRIVVVGYSNVTGNDGFAVARVLANGSAVDSTFAGDGTAVVQFDLGGTNEDRASSVAVQPDGKVVVAGWADRGAGNFDMAVLRFTTAGDLDATFDADGKQTVAFDLAGAKDDRAAAVAVTAAGGIVLAGTAEAAVGSHDVAVARLQSNGALDTGFDADGKVTVELLGDDRAAAVVARPDGGVLLAATSVRAAGESIVVVLQRTAAGAVDTAFGVSNGNIVPLFAATPASGAFTRTEVAAGLVVDSEGRIVVAASTNNGVLNGPDNFTAIRLVPNGSNLDTSFTTAGVPQVDFGGDDEAAGVALDANGRIVLAGKTSLDGDFAIARLVGAVEKPQRVVVGGAPDGRAQVFAPAAGGALPAAASATLAAFGSTTSTVRTASGDWNGDGIADTILVTGPGTPIRVAVVSGADNSTVLVPAFDPFSGDFTGGGFVAAADFDLNGKTEFVVTPDEGGGPRVLVYARNVDGTATVRASFLGIDDANFRGGARAAVGDVNGDGVPDLAVAAGFGGGPRVALFGGKSVIGSAQTRLIADFFAFPGPDATTLRNGVFVAAGDVDGDGFADLVFGGGPGGGPRVFTLSGSLITAGNVTGAQAAPLSNFFVAGNADDRGGVRVGVTDLDGDNKADVVAGSGENRPAQVRIYLGASRTSAAEPTGFQDVSLFGGLTLPGGVYVG